MNAPAPELSRLLAIEGIIPDKVREETVVATPEECAALAQRLDLRALEGLSAELSIRRVSGGSVLRVSGHIQAEVVQSCVVSLRDVPATIDTRFETFFTQDGEAGSSAKELSFTAEDEDAPEMIVNGMIDLGEVVTQYLSLELNPYPRAPGVSLAAHMAETGSVVTENPFAALSKLKEDKK